MRINAPIEKLKQEKYFKKYFGVTRINYWINFVISLFNGYLIDFVTIGVTNFNG